MEKKQRFLINMLYYVVIAVIVLLGLRYLLPVLLPFVIALLMAMAATSLSRKVCGQHRRQRGFFARLFTAGFYVLLFGALIFGGSRILSMGGQVVTELPKLYQMMGQMLLSMDQLVADISSNAVRAVSDFVVQIPSMVVVLVITIVASFFIASDYSGSWIFFKK